MSIHRLSVILSHKTFVWLLAVSLGLVSLGAGCPPTPQMPTEPRSSSFSGNTVALLTESPIPHVPDPIEGLP
jgi:hypothetical protein